MADRLLEWSDVNYDLELEIAEMFKEECGDNFFAKTKQMIADMRLKDEGTLLPKDSKKMKKGQNWNFLVLDQSKWPIKTPAQLTIPKQLKDVFEDFIQMYERTKRVSKPSAGPSGKNSKNKQPEKAPAAIIMNWVFNQGSCELQTYTLSDHKRQPFLIKLSCNQGLVLLQFHAKEDKRSARELAKSTGMPIGIVEQICVYLHLGGLFKEVEHIQPTKYMINENYNKTERATHIDLSYPTADAKASMELEKYKALGLETIVYEQKEVEEGAKNQAIFVENLRHRIDARVVKNLKDNKKMSLRDMLDKVMVDLGLHMTMPTAEE